MELKFAREVEQEDLGHIESPFFAHNYVREAFYRQSGLRMISGIDRILSNGEWLFRTPERNEHGLNCILDMLENGEVFLICREPFSPLLERHEEVGGVVWRPSPFHIGHEQAKSSAVWISEHAPNRNKTISQPLKTQDNAESASALNLKITSKNESPVNKNLLSGKNVVPTSEKSTLNSIENQTKTAFSTASNKLGFVEPNGAPLTLQGSQFKAKTWMDESANDIVNVVKSFGDEIIGEFKDLFSGNDDFPNAYSNQTQHNDSIVAFVNSNKIKQGTYNNAKVKELQRMLTDAGYPLVQDGDWGKGTQQAYENYLRDHVLTDVEKNGEPTSTVTLTCQNACIKLGDSGPLIEELNIRLTGFGGTISSPKPLNEFTHKTENAIKQFQRDYMGVAETGKVCGPLLRALDEFRTKYTINLSSMKCPCGYCDGFGNGFNDSSQVGMFENAQRTIPHAGIEYPGMHRALLWGMRAALFYVGVKDKHLTYAFLAVSSGYRCWHNNARHQRISYNHMGNALDLQFKKGNATIRCSGADIDRLRRNIFVERLGAQEGWRNTNMLSLETRAQGATSWIHMDVRKYDAQYKASRFYVTTQTAADEEPIVDTANREGKTQLIVCNSESTIAPASMPGSESRIAISILSISQKGIDFIKGWEKCKLQPYNDSRGYCTIGWGRLIAERKCENLNTIEIAPYSNGITQEAADKYFLMDLQYHEDIVKKAVNVPMFQHEYDALVSLIYNIGRFSKCPKLLKNLNNSNYNGCCDEFSDITNKGEKGLVKRRKAEINMFRNKIYDS